MHKTALLTATLLVLSKIPLWGQTLPSDPVVIGNFLREAPNGIAWIVDDQAAFVMDPEKGYSGNHYTPAIAAPDGAYHRSQFQHDGARVVIEWGRLGDNVAGRISSDQETSLVVGLSSGWPGWESSFTGTTDGAVATAQIEGKAVHWTVKMSPPPAAASSSNVTISVSSSQPVRFVAGLSILPAMESVDETLRAAAEKFEAARPQAAGDWGDFVSAIADNVNNSRLYSSDNHLLAHCVSRGWGKTANTCPYFCWDSFFTANLAAIDDPVTARNTVRAILSCQTDEGLVPNFGHWGTNWGPKRASTDRSQPPVGSWCVWKMHQRYPDDLAFLREVYPKLVRWHDWWPKYRDAKHDGLLEWGSTTGGFQAAQWETGWDDNLHFADARMVGKTMNCYAVDLCSMWAQDAHYLALLADALGQGGDAKRFRAEQTAMNQRINDKLWNQDLHAYCSRFWDDAEYYHHVPTAAFAPGFEGEFFSGEDLKSPVSTAHADKLDFDWKGEPPLKGMAATHWSARWKAILTVPETGDYRFTVAADDGIRVYADGKRIIDEWSTHGAVDRVANLHLEQGLKVEIVVAYFQAESGSSLRLAVDRIEAANGRFLTRVTPMNFYPLSGGTPDAERAGAVFSLLADPKKFWGKYLLPTLAYDDPDWHLQHYWKGHVWGPVNYIVFDGIKRYATPEQIAEFADRNVGLFMTNWITKGLCGENYSSENGHQNCDPHYTWGALLCLVGLESIVDVDDQNRIVLNGTQNKTIQLTNIPLLGSRYDVKTSPGRAQLFRGGKVVLEAKGEIVHATVQ